MSFVNAPIPMNVLTERKNASEAAWDQVFNAANLAEENGAATDVVKALRAAEDLLVAEHRYLMDVWAKDYATVVREVYSPAKLLSDLGYGDPCTDTQDLTWLLESAPPSVVLCMASLVGCDPYDVAVVACEAVAMQAAIGHVGEVL